VLILRAKGGSSALIVPQRQGTSHDINSNKKFKKSILIWDISTGKAMDDEILLV
jgi:hypothetical protein